MASNSETSPTFSWSINVRCKLRLALLRAISAFWARVAFITAILTGANKILKATAATVIMAKPAATGLRQW